MTGTVVSNTGNIYDVLPDGAAHNDDAALTGCRAKGNFRLKGIRTTSPVAVGDRVTYTPPAPGAVHGYITAIEPRKNYIIRRASNLSKEAHIIAANLDQALLVATLAHPETSTTFIDRFMATAEAYGVQPVLAINKTDLLANEPDGPELIDAVAALYRSIGYTVVCCSAATGQGFDDLRDILRGKVTLLGGNSGVGKSTLINALVPGAQVRTAPISDVHDTGMHTTTSSHMYPLPLGGAIIDTPGVRGFGTVDMDIHEVGHFFPEIFRHSTDCRYGDCTHTHEPGCAVLDAVADHRIAASRYSSYLSILDDSTDGKYRKPY